MPLFRVMKSKDEIITFLSQVHSHYYVLISFAEFRSRTNRRLFELQDIVNQKFFKAFFEVNYENLHKIKTMRMYKRCGGRYSQYCVCHASWLRWRLRDFIITKDGVIYCDSKNKTVKEFIPFGRAFSYKVNHEEDGDYKMQLRSNHRTLSIRA